jgi:hypothetical protein
MIGTSREKLAGRIAYPSNQIYIAPDGLVYSNPIAMVLGRSSGDIRATPLEKIARRMYP